jgi:hypothetical protein
MDFGFDNQNRGCPKMPAGGRREGGGRPRGAKDKRPRMSVKALLENNELSRMVLTKTKGMLPLPYMLKLMNDKKQPAERRDKMAIAAAPFCHARLVYAEIKRPSAMSDTELERAINIAEEDLLRHGVGRDRWPQAIH